VIFVENLDFSYTGSRPYILENLCFRVQAGKYVSILGNNGAGKSTLIRLLLGLLQPIRGEVSVARGSVAYVPQTKDFSDTRFPITVAEMLDSYRRLRRIRDRGRTLAVLTAVGLADTGHRLFGSLSGGQRQRALLARALLVEPRLLVLDEPSTGVDAPSRTEIYDLLKDLNRTQGVTIVSVEHNLPAALQNSTTVYHMEAGRGHFCDPTRYAAEFLATASGGRI